MFCGPFMHEFGGQGEQGTIPTSTTPAGLLIALYSGILCGLSFEENGMN